MKVIRATFRRGEPTPLNHTWIDVEDHQFISKKTSMWVEDGCLNITTEGRHFVAPMSSVSYIELSPAPLDQPKRKSREKKPLSKVVMRPTALEI